MAFEPSDAVEVRRARGQGLGVFARRAIEEGEVIETCPVLVLPAGSVGDFSEGVGPYVFEWGTGKLGLALGYGSLYNHSYEPDARYEDIGGRSKLFVALRDTRAGEEITVKDNGDPTDRSPVWFDVIEGATRQLDQKSSAIGLP